MIKNFIMLQLNILWNSKNQSICETILFNACLSGNLKLVKYIIDLDKIDITEKNVFNFIFL